MSQLRQGRQLAHGADNCSRCAGTLQLRPAALPKCCPASHAVSPFVIARPSLLATTSCLPLCFRDPPFGPSLCIHIPHLFCSSPNPRRLEHLLLTACKLQHQGEHSSGKAVEPWSCRAAGPPRMCTAYCLRLPAAAASALGAAALSRGRARSAAGVPPALLQLPRLQA